MNCKIHPVLYHWYLILRENLGASIVHRRQRRSQTSIEVIFYNDLVPVITGRINSLPDAEKCGYWVICRLQTKPGHTEYKGHRVYQLYLSPVHHKKRHGILPIFLPDFVKPSVRPASATAAG